MPLVSTKTGLPGPNRRPGAPEPLLVLRNIRLTADQVRRLASTLTELLSGLEDAGEGESRYGVLAGLYEPRQPQPGRPSRP